MIVQWVPRAEAINMIVKCWMAQNLMCKVCEMLNTALVLQVCGMRFILYFIVYQLVASCYPLLYLLLLLICFVIRDTHY